MVVVEGGEFPTPCKERGNCPARTVRGGICPDPQCQISVASWFNRHQLIEIRSMRNLTLHARDETVFNAFRCFKAKFSKKGSYIICW